MNFLSKTLGILSLTIFAAKAQVPALDMDMSIYSFYVDSAKVYALKGGMRFGVQADGNITDSLSYSGKMNIFFEEGSHTALNNDSYESATTYGIDNAHLKWSPIDFFNIKIGVTQVEKEYSPLFIHSPSLGLSEHLKLADYDFFEFSIHSHQNVVSTNTTQSGSGDIENKAPYYLLNGFKGLIKFSQNSFHFQLNHFNFNKLTADNANKSRFRGSDVINSGDNSLFSYEYSGYDIALAFKTALLFEETTLYIEYLKNTESQDEANLYGLNIRFNKSYALKLEHFSNEANTLPAIVVSPYYGGTNREGQHIQLGYFTKDGSLKISFYQMDTIVTGPYQASMNLASFNYTIDI